jgi:histidyl-tRNA synthetase
MFGPLRVGPDVLVCWLDVPAAAALDLGDVLRKGGLRVEVYPEVAKLKKQLGYASGPGVQIPWVVIVGAQELQAGKMTLKNLATGEQSTATPAEIIAAIGARA